MSKEIQPSVLEIVRHLSPDELREVAKAALAGLELDGKAEIVGPQIEEFYTPDNGYIHPRVFPHVANVMALATYELPTVRVGEDDELEILLAQRMSKDGTDPWEGQIHVPGMVIRNNDPFPYAEHDDEMAVDFSDFAAPRERLLQVEGGGALRPIGPLVPMPTVGRVGARGLEITVRDLLPVEMQEGKELPEGTKWFNIRNVLAEPPQGLVFIGSHRRLIQDVSQLVGGIASLQQSYGQGKLF